jgi:hypothetical protein
MEAGAKMPTIFNRAEGGAPNLPQGFRALPWVGG